MVGRRPPHPAFFGVTARPTRGLRGRNPNPAVGAQMAMQALVDLRGRHDRTVTCPEIGRHSTLCWIGGKNASRRARLRGPAERREPRWANQALRLALPAEREREGSPRVLHPRRGRKAHSIAEFGPGLASFGNLLDGAICRLLFHRGVSYPPKIERWLWLA